MKDLERNERNVAPKKARETFGRALVELIEKEEARRKAAWIKIEKDEAELFQRLIREGQLRGVSLEEVRERCDRAIKEIQNW